MFSDVSSLAAGVDRAFFFILLVSVLLLIGITGVMIYFVFRYRRSRNPAAESIEGNTALEIIWIVVPTILVLGMFYYGWIGFRALRDVPQDAMRIKVEARMWKWSFEYGNGKKSPILRVPIGKNIALTMTSKDVIHSLYIPAFRVKEDLVPGQMTTMWFVSNRLGTYDLFCAEYCGVGHSAMGSKVVVMPEKEFASWYDAKEEEGLETLDGAALVEKHGCLPCHSTDGSRRLGPTFKGIFGKEIVVLSSGKERNVVVDELYLRRAILSPEEDVVKGFQPIMVSVKGILSEKEIQAIIDYLKDLR